jgi:hypothetical protein
MKIFSTLKRNSANSKGEPITQLSPDQSVNSGTPVVKNGGKKQLYLNYFKGVVRIFDSYGKPVDLIKAPTEAQLIDKLKASGYVYLDIVMDK